MQIGQKRHRCLKCEQHLNKKEKWGSSVISLCLLEQELHLVVFFFLIHSDVKKLVLVKISPRSERGNYRGHRLDELPDDLTFTHHLQFHSDSTPTMQVSHRRPPPTEAFTNNDDNPPFFTRTRIHTSMKSMTLTNSTPVCQ